MADRAGLLKVILCLLLATITLMIAACGAQETAQPADNTWVGPAKVQITNLRPGNSVGQKITIHNGGKTGANFLVYYRTPDYVQKGYVMAPAEAPNWLKIEDENPILAPGETRDIQVILDLPDNAQTPERWEFWIGVRENSGSSLVAELASRWLITVKDN